MDIILDVIVAVIGIAVFFIPLFLWNKRFGKTSISIATVKKRKQYKKVATLGFLLLVVVGIDFMTMDSDYSSSLALYIIVGYIFASIVESVLSHTTILQWLKSSGNESIVSF